MKQQQFVAGGELQPSARLGGVSTDVKACFVDRGGGKDAELAHGSKRSAPGAVPTEQFVWPRKLRRYHLIAERRDVCHARLATLLQIAAHRHERVMKMFVNRCDDDPVSAAAAFLPDVVLQVTLREDKRRLIGSREPTGFDARMGRENGVRFVGRAIVENNVAVDPGVVVSEEEGENIS